MPWDLLLVLSGGYAWLLTWLWGLFINAVAADLYTVYSRIIYQGVAALALCGGAVLLALFVSLAARSKEKGWLKNALLYRLGCWFGRVLHHPLRRLWDVLRSLPMIWKTVLFCACAIGVECLCLYWLYWDGAVLPIILFNVVICVVLLACAACNKRLQQGCRAIADGNMNFRVDTRRMFGDFRGPGRGPEPDRLRHRRGGGGAAQVGAVQNRADHQRLPRPQDPPHQHRQLCGSAEQALPARGRPLLCGGASAPVRPAEKADGGPGGGAPRPPPAT